MELERDEQEMLDGKHGRAKQRAMELLVRYGEALGAQRFVDTDNVHLLIGFHPYPEVVKFQDVDELISKFFLDTDERIVVDYVETFNTTHIWTTDMNQWREMGASESLHELMEVIRLYCVRTGINVTATCTPYQVGNVPTKGEHCAWTESSAVPFCNAVLGARTNTETAHSAFAIALTGKVPLSGFHMDENRFGTHLIDVEIDPDSVFDWNLLGYFAGDIVQLGVPTYNLSMPRTPNLSMLKGMNAAGASSGGVQMYHIIGVTPEAPNAEAAFGGKKPRAVVKYGKEERRQTYEMLNSAKDDKVDMITLGCPHYSLEQLRRVARLLDGKKVRDNVNLWVWTSHQLKALADRNGYTDIIKKAGALLLADACPLLTKGVFPEGTRIVATDSAKQAHYTPGVTGLDTWFGSMEDCIDCAITGKWTGEIK
jgi:predicted aconitase